jgi:hypothetical protein
MKTINIEECMDGMILAWDITGDSGQVLLPAGAVLNSDNVKSLKNRGVTKVVIKDEADNNIPEFSEEEIQSSKDMYYDVVAQRFLDPEADNMVRALFNAVLELTARRVLSGK